MAKASPDVCTDAAAHRGPSYVDFMTFDADTVERAMDSNVAPGAGLETIGQEVAQYARTALETAGETACGLLRAGTLEDVVRLQTDFAKRSFEDFLAHGAKRWELGSPFVGAWGACAKR